jgi:AcrR family transcriptional regulator
MSEDDPRCRILNAAGPIFAEKGYEAGTVREICQAAGVNLAAVNYYFGGKERLYEEALRQAHPAKSGPAPDFDWPEGTPPGQKLDDFIRWLLVHMLSVRKSPWQERLFVREIMDPTPAFRELLCEHFRTGFEQLQKILDEILPDDMPRHKRYQIGFSIIGQCVYYRAGRHIVSLIVGEEDLKAHYGAEQLAEHISQVSLGALGLGPPLAGPRGPESGSDRTSNSIVDQTAQPAGPTGKGAD